MSQGLKFGLLGHQMSTASISSGCAYTAHCSTQVLVCLETGSTLAEISERFIQADLPNGKKALPRGVNGSVQNPGLSQLQHFFTQADSPWTPSLVSRLCLCVGLPTRRTSVLLKQTAWFASPRLISQSQLLIQNTKLEELSWISKRDFSLCYPIHISNKLCWDTKVTLTSKTESYKDASVHSF